MIIPIRCFTCGKILADKWEPYLNSIQSKKNKLTIYNYNKNNEDTIEKKTLDKLKINRYCCRRMMLAHIDMCDKI